jgi:hypothetical protein
MERRPALVWGAPEGDQAARVGLCIVIMVRGWNPSAL